MPWMIPDLNIPKIIAQTKQVFCSLGKDPKNWLFRVQEKIQKSEASLK